MVELQLPKLTARVRFPSSAPANLRRLKAVRIRFIWCCESKLQVGPRRQRLRAPRSGVWRGGGDDSRHPLKRICAAFRRWGFAICGDELSL